MKWSIVLPSTWIRTLAWLFLLAGVLHGATAFTFGSDDEIIWDNVIDDASDQLFDPTRLHDIRITMNPADFEGMRRAQLREWREAQRLIFDNTLQIERVGIQAGAVRADDPRYYNHPTLELDFGRFVPGQRLQGLRLVGIRSWSTDDDSLLIEQLGMALIGEFGLPYERVAHAWVTINGQPIGLYVMRDRIRIEDYVPRFFPDTRGNLYKLQDTANSGEQLTDFDGFIYTPNNPDDPSTYIPFPFEPFGGGARADGSDILRLIQAVNRPTSAQVRAELAPLLNIDKLIDYLAVNMSLADTDGLIAYGIDPPYHFQNNGYFYHDPTTDQFFLLPGDAKGAFDAFIPQSVNRELVDGWDVMNITKWMLNEPDIMQRYFQRVRAFMDTIYIPDRLSRRIDAMASLIRPAIRADTLKPITDAAWEGKVNSLKQYIRNREANVRRQLGP
jgi:spore coat protein CotH